uniref:Uncharacterized protein n=1 Tax=Arundo donax TaxID=35708 RepID=A0A0A8YQN2_ARUDO
MHSQTELVRVQTAFMCTNCVPKRKSFLVCIEFTVSMYSVASYMSKNLTWSNQNSGSSH